MSNKIELFLNDFAEEITLHPKYNKINEIVVKKSIPKINIDNMQWKSDIKVKKTKSVNRSISFIEVIIENVGDSDIESYEISIEIDGEVLNLKENTSVENSEVTILGSKIKFESKEGEILEVGDNRFFQIEFKTSAKDQNLFFNWESNVDDQKDNGVLKIIIKPEIIEKDIEVLEKTSSKENGYIKDYFEDVELEEPKKEGCIFKM